MAPSITLRHNGADSGDLVTAAINLGVPHPTGYPLYTLIAHLFTRLSPAEPAWGVNLFSALAAALAVGTVFWACFRWITAQEGEGLTPALAVVAAMAAAGLFAVGELLWSQATIAEVYSLNALLAGAILAAALCLPLPRRAAVLALLFGLGLAHHVTIVWLVPALWPYAAAIRRWLTLRRALILVLCLLPGLLTYLSIPLRAAAHPVPNWGRAVNLAGLRWLVSGAAYRGYAAAVLPVQWSHRFAAWAGIWVRDLGIIGLALALLGLWRTAETDRRFALFGLTYAALLSGYAMLYRTSDSYVYLLPVAALLALWTARGAGVLLRALGQTQDGMVRRLATAVAVLLLLALPLAGGVGRYATMDLSGDHEAQAFARAVLDAAAPNSLIISRGDAQTFPLWYLRYGLHQRPDVAVVDRWLLAFDWYRADLALVHPELSAVTQAHSDQEAATALVEDAGLRPVVHLTYEDDSLTGFGTWVRLGPLFTLQRQ